ncbi:Alpha/Beta hydrolase protein [Mycena filopes]|nr:Alpha/Beta hydrolase protein [Mycena filopes]
MVEVVTGDKIVLRCCLMRWSEQSRTSAIATIIMFHGNAMTYPDLVPVARAFLLLGCNVLMVSYRGYADSEGTPSENGLSKDAQAAIDYVEADAELSRAPIILYGLSLGGAVAIKAASERPADISALIIENTFESLPRVVRGFPIIGIFSFLCTQRWNSYAKIRRIPPSTPILMLSGFLDAIVPRKHMENLWGLAQKRGVAEHVPEKDRFESFPAGHHASTFECHGYWEKVADFLSSVTAPNSVVAGIAIDA